MTGFNNRIQAYGAWRAALAEALTRYAHWLAEAGLADASMHQRFVRSLERLATDRMSIAFVAEFSRGKSELINALFFSDYGQRVLPTSAGRTTMCPTELMYDSAEPPGIRLLPIETRMHDMTVTELRKSPREWVTVPFEPGNLASLRAAFDCVRETKRVPRHEAVLLGMVDETDSESPLSPDTEGLIEVSRWRHAIANLPHPLLESGLVIIDTPGLNSIGAEPELTLNVIPSAQAVLFLLSADAGVTRSDIEVWRDRISPAHQSGRFVVLNKIDGSWDGMRSDAEIDAEISLQVDSVARVLQLPRENVFAVSAQKGLLAKVVDDDALLARSRLPELEQALALEIVPRQKTIISDQLRREFDESRSLTHALLATRRRNLVEQVLELNGLRGKNRATLEQIARRVKLERAEFDGTLRQTQALRTVLGRHEQSIQNTIRIDQLKRHVREARQQMRASSLSIGLSQGMNSLLLAVRSDFNTLSDHVAEVQSMMVAMYASFNREHGLVLGAPASFSTQSFIDELARIEALQRQQFGALSLVTTEKWALTRRFFESVALRIRDVYERAGEDTQNWLRALMAPIDSQVREHQAQLRRRVDSVRRVMEASGHLQERIAQIEEDRARLDAELDRSAMHAAEVTALLGHEAPAVPAAVSA
jgi:predicted GTPase